MDGSRVKPLAARRKHLKAVVNEQRKHRATSLDSNMKSASPKLAQCASARAAALWKHNQGGPAAQTVEALLLNLFCCQAFCINVLCASHGGRKEKEQPEGPAFCDRHTLA